MQISAPCRYLFNSSSYVELIVSPATIIPCVYYQDEPNELTMKTLLTKLTETDKFGTSRDIEIMENKHHLRVFEIKILSTPFS